MFSTAELQPRGPRSPRGQEPTEMQPRSGVSNPIFSCLKAPILHIGMARNLSCTDLLHGSPQVTLAAHSILNQTLLSSGYPNQSRRQTDIRAALLSERCHVNISLPLLDPYDKENCSLSPYPVVLMHQRTPVLRHSRLATRFPPLATI